MSEGFDRIVVSFFAGVAGTVVSAFITVDIVGYGFERPEFTPFAALFIGIGILTAWLTYRAKYSNSYDDLCKQYPNGVMDWAIEKKLLKNHTDNLSSISYKYKVEAVKSEAGIVIKEQRIRDQYQSIQSNTSHAVFDLYTRRYKQNKYAIVKHKYEIEQEEKKHQKAIREKLINARYDELKRKYPIGLPAFVKQYPNLSKEELTEREADIKVYDAYASVASTYSKWEKEQGEFCERCRKLGEDMFPNFGRYGYDVEYERINSQGDLSTYKYKVLQFFPSSICLDVEEKNLAILPTLLENTKRLPQFKSHEWTFADDTYKKILNFISKLGQAKDILVYYSSDSSGWTVEEQWKQLSPIITDEHDWVEYDCLSDDMIGVEPDPEKDFLEKFKGKYIVVLEVMSENHKLKALCKRIRETYTANAPCICYISLLKCYDQAEAEKRIKTETDKALQKLKELKEKQRAQNSLVESVSSWETLVGGLHYSYLFYYYPTTCEFEATEEEWSNRWIVWDFKNTPGKTTVSDHQEALNKAIPMLTNKLTTTFGTENLKYLTLVCIPASSQVKTQARYEEFSNRICRELGMINAYPHISVVSAKEEKHLGGTGLDTSKLHFDEDFFKGKYVLLFDDVITRGDSMRTFKRKMESLGATVVGGLSLGKTKHERPVVVTETPRIFSRPPFPPQQTYDNGDDLPF